MWTNAGLLNREEGSRRAAQHQISTLLSSSSIFFNIHLTTLQFTKIPPRREGVHRQTRSTPAVDEADTSSSPGRIVDGGPPGLQSSAGSTFSCIQCTKIFNRRENLSRHLKTRKSLFINASSPRVHVHFVTTLEDESLTYPRRCVAFSSLPKM